MYADNACRMAANRNLRRFCRAGMIACARRNIFRTEWYAVSEIYVDGDACPVREEVYRVAGRLSLQVFVVSNGSRPIRPPGLDNVRMIVVGRQGRRGG